MVLSLSGSAATTCTQGRGTMHLGVIHIHLKGLGQRIPYSSVRGKRFIRPSHREKLRDSLGDELGGQVEGNLHLNDSLRRQLFSFK